MKRIRLLLYICCVATVARAQQTVNEPVQAQQIVNGKWVNGKYNDVSLSDALSQFAEQQTGYAIMFLYNELEDFRITTTVSHKTLPDAIRQMIGFYPIRMTVDESDAKGKKIFVECTQKTDRHLTGTIVDEQGLPVAYANVAVLHPADSTLLSGGVSNESGYFAIPYERQRVGDGTSGMQENVLVRISYVGYKTIYRHLPDGDGREGALGTIRMQPETQALKGVTVKGQRLLYTSTTRGLLVTVQDTPLTLFGSASEMLSHLPLVMSDGSVAGHGKPEIYINNKKVRNTQELDRLRADEILSAEVITNPGVEYGAEVTSVIRLKTVRRQGEGWSGNFSSVYRQGKECYASGNAALNYRLRNGMDFFARGFLASNNQVITATAADQLRASSVWDFQKRNTFLNRQNYYYADLGWNWELSERHSLGLTYTANNYLTDATSSIETDEEVWRDGQFLEAEANKTLTSQKPRMEHALNAYYVGEIGKWQLDLSADYYGGHSASEMEGGTIGEQVIGSQTLTKNNLLAEKLVVTAPVPSGSLTFGEETSHVNRTSDFTQSGFSADNSVRQQTTTWSLFASYALQVKALSLNAGLRWQNELNDYETNGQKDAEQSPDYHVLIPRLSLTYRTENWMHGLSYNCSRRNPSYSSLGTAVNYRSKYEYSTGNPYLRPVTTNYLVWTTKYRWAYAELYYAYIKNTNYSFQSAYDDANHPGVILDDRRNLPRMQNYGIELNLSPKVGIWQMNYTARFAFSNQNLEAIGITHKWNGLWPYFDLDNTFSLPHDWMLNIEADLTPYHASGCSQTKATGAISLYLSHQFLKDKSLSVAFIANDILHTSYTEMTAYGGINVRTQFRQYDDDRRIGLNLSWKFNATHSRYKGSHAGQSERNRL